MPKFRTTINECRAFLLTVTIALILMAMLTTTAGAENLENVVVISIDALHPDALQQSKAPHLQMLMRNGAFSLNGRSTHPPKTLIAHTAMFTGMSPEENGKVDNDWWPGETTVQKRTIFDSAREYGFETGYFYSKEKLGYLVSRAIDVHEWSRASAIDSAEDFLKLPGRHFVFLHISGLDEVGPEFGWLSAEYLEELSYIDEYLAELIASIKSRKNHLIVVTSDHAGHAKVHGTDHPEDYKLPLVLYSDTVPIKHFQDVSFSIIDFKEMIEPLMKDTAL
jgi:predicted AlkP superfamily pyrophosphatase or phosphodiesterase